jgi:hypothetical protein
MSQESVELTHAGDPPGLQEAAGCRPGYILSVLFDKHD